MLHKIFDQAHGLQRLELQAPTRVLPVVASTEGSHSLELLWQLEQGFRGLRLPVAVIEGAGGLGVADATQGYRQVLARWLDGVPPGSVVLLHAPLAALSTLLADSQARPLVVLTPQPGALVQAYNAIKVLWQAAGLEAIVVPMDVAPLERTGAADPQRAMAPLPVAHALQALLQTCEQRLSRLPLAWPLGYDRQGEGESVRAFQQANLLKMLDSALILDDLQKQKHDARSPQRRPSPADQIIGVADVYRQRHA